MAIYDSALYQGHLWYSYTLKNTMGKYNEEFRLSMRKESQACQFACPDCKETMVLCAGNIMEPYFRHLKDADCSRKSIPGQGHTLTARRMLYHLLYDCFPNGEILPNQKTLFEGSEVVELKTDFLVSLPDGSQLAASYLSSPVRLREWEMEHLIYQSEGITDIWFLNARYFYSEAFTTFEYLISKYYPQIYYLDYETNCLQLREQIILSGGIQKLLLYQCPLDEVGIDLMTGKWVDYEGFRRETLSAWEGPNISAVVEPAVEVYSDSTTSPASQEENEYIQMELGEFL